MCLRTTPNCAALKSAALHLNLDEVYGTVVGAFGIECGARVFSLGILKVRPSALSNRGDFMKPVIGASCSSSSDVVALPDPKVDNPLAASKGSETAVLAGGCFWGIQAVFVRLKGVLRATSGYSGGAANTAQYETVCTGRTGHAESVEVAFDPSLITFGQILKVFFSVAHDPTQLNRQGVDVGTQYRSAIF